MNKTRLLTVIASSLVVSQALAIEPVFEGDDGIRAKVFESNCLACHSSEKTGSSRNNAPTGVDYDNYATALKNGARAVIRGVTSANMPPSFSNLGELNTEQKQALKNWQALGFPEHALPPIYSTDSSTLVLPKVYIKDVQGDIVQRFSVDMALISGQQAVQFEVTHIEEINDSNGDHVHQ